jgi:hypothetical protein
MSNARELPNTNAFGIGFATAQLIEESNRVGSQESVPDEGSLRAGTACALSKEGLRLGSCKIDRNDYSGDCSDDAADESHLAAVDDLSDSERYRDDVDYDAPHPSPFGASEESGSECEAEDSEYDDYVRECYGSRAHSCKTRGASEEREQTSCSSNDGDYGNADRSLGLWLGRCHVSGLRTEFIRLSVRRIKR